MSFLRPSLPVADYIISIEVMGEHGVWYKKDGTGFGSTDDYVTIRDIFVK